MNISRIGKLHLISIFVLLSLISEAQTLKSGQYPTRIFGPDDYEAHQTILCVLEDDNGFLLLANTDGVLAFNGNKWELIKLERNSRALWLSQDKTGRVFVAGEDEFGYLTLTNKHYSYTSLIPLLPDSLSGFGSTWEVESTAYGTYFRSSRYLFWYHDQRIDVIPYDQYPGGTWDIITTVNDTLYLKKRELGIGKVVGSEFKLLPNGTAHKEEKINAIISHDEQLLVLTRHAGVFQLTKEKWVPYATKIQQALSEAKIYDAAVRSNLLAIATLTNGVYLLDENGELIAHINETDYGINEAAYSVYFDKQGALWIGTLNGVARVEIQDVIKVHPSLTRKDHNIYAIQRFNGKLFVGTHAGLFKVHQGNFQDAEQMPGFVGRINHLKIMDGVLVANGYEGTFFIDSTFQVTKSGILGDFYKMKESPLYLTAGQEGLQLFKKTGKNTYEAIRKLVVPNNMEFVYEFDKNQIWAASSSAGLTYYDIATDSTLTFLELGNTRIRSIENVPYFVTSKGVFEFTNKRLQKSSLIYDKIDSTQYTVQDVQSDASGNVIILYHDEQSKTHGMWLKKRKVGYDQLLIPDFGIKKTDFITAYLEENGRLWIAGNKRIFEINLNSRLPAPTSFKVLITSILINDQPIELSQFEGELPFAKNRLSFHFGSLHLSSFGSNRFKYRLVGLDEKWSAWSEESSITYPYLPPGEYTFEIQGKSPYQLDSNIESFSFVILEPWYSTNRAFLLYALVLIASVILIVKLRTAMHKHDRLKLQQIIEERTEEIADKNRKLEEMDKVKNRFYSNISHEFRTPLTLIIGPLEDYLETDEKPTKQAYQGLIKNARRLLDLINQLLDLTKLEAKQMSLNLEEHSLKAYLSEIYSSFEQMSKLKEIDFELEQEHEEDRARFDTDMMDKILYNLLANAFKFTPAYGKVTLTTKGDATSFQLIISDTGSGISKEHVPYIFDRFYQSHETHHSAQPGTGIGLSLVRELVTLHGGTVEVKSTPGEGSTFVVELPRKVK